MPFKSLVNQTVPSIDTVRPSKRVKSQNPRSRTPLTEHEKQKIYNMRVDGHPWTYIATVMGRNSESIRRSMIRDFGDAMSGTAKYAGVPVEERK